MSSPLNNPKVVLPAVGVAVVALVGQFAPVDWGQEWERMVAGDLDQLVGATEPVEAVEEIPVQRLLALRPKVLSGELPQGFLTQGARREIFPEVARPEELRPMQKTSQEGWPSDLRLEAAYRQGNRRLAVISGRIFEEGDYLGGVKVEEVGEGKVVLSLKEEKRELALTGGSAQKTAAVPPPKSSPAPVPDAKPAPTGLAGEGVPASVSQELERLQQLQKLLEVPSKLLEGSK